MLCSVGFGGLVGNHLILLCFLIVSVRLGRTFGGLVGLFLKKYISTPVLLACSHKRLRLCF